MVAISVRTSDEVHPALVAAVAENAERQAVMVAGLLDALDPRLKEAGFPTGAAGLPAEFLLELGALCQLTLWEGERLRDYLPPELPTAQQAKADFHYRATNAPDSFQSRPTGMLPTQIMQVWLERFAWAAPNLLQADIVLGDADEDALVDALAQFLWDHRHDDSTSEGQQTE